MSGEVRACVRVPVGEGGVAMEGRAHAVEGLAYEYGRDEREGRGYGRKRGQERGLAVCADRTKQEAPQENFEQQPASRNQFQFPSLSLTISEFPVSQTHAKIPRTQDADRSERKRTGTNMHVWLWLRVGRDMTSAERGKKHTRNTTRHDATQKEVKKKKGKLSLGEKKCRVAIARAEKHGRGNQRVIRKETNKASGREL